MKAVRIDPTFALLAALTLPATSSAQTAMFRNGPEHLGVYDSPSPTLQTLAWKFKTGGRVISSPLVVGDVVYVGSTDGSLYAVNKADGTQRWKFDSRGPISSSPAFHAGTVYILSMDGLVYAVDAETGKSRWTFATKGERRFTAPGIHGATPRTERMPDPFDVFTSSPTIANGTVYIGSGDQNVYALDAATGALRWTFATGDVVHASPAVANNTVFIGSWDRNVYALDAQRGVSAGATPRVTTRSSTTRSGSPARPRSRTALCMLADVMANFTRSMSARARCAGCITTTAAGPSHRRQCGTVSSTFRLPMARGSSARRRHR
jgi:outer membrane protein assembly factor BamB